MVFPFRYAALKFADVNNLSDSIFDKLAEKMSAEKKEELKREREKQKSVSPQFGIPSGTSQSPNLNLFASGPPTVQSPFINQVPTQQTFVSTGFSPMPMMSTSPMPFPQASSNPNVMMSYTTTGQMAPIMQPAIGLMQQQPNWNSTSSLPNAFNQANILQPQTTQPMQPAQSSIQAPATPQKKPSPFQDLDPLGGRGGMPNTFAAPKNTEPIGQVGVFS